MKKKTYADGLRDAWELINKHGISVIPDQKDTMFVTVSHGKSQDELRTSLTFFRPSETGILAWLPDAEWKKLKEGNVLSH